MLISTFKDLHRNHKYHDNFPRQAKITGGELLNSRILAISSGALLLAACGSTASAIPGAPTTTSHLTATTVYTLLTSKTAQVVQSGAPASFTVTALSEAGAPIANAPVTFYIGQMTPLSGVGVKKWFTSGTAAANAYVKSASSKTDSNGKATLILNGQPSNTMEMIGVTAGSLSTYNSAKGAIGSIDAWWTTAGANPTAPVGDYVTVSPFATKSTAMNENLSILVSSPQGPISGASVSVAPRTSTSTAMMSASTPMKYTTGSNGIANVTVNFQATTPFRIVATQGTTTARIAGGMNALITTQS